MTVRLSIAGHKKPILRRVHCIHHPVLLIPRKGVCQGRKIPKIRERLGMARLQPTYPPIHLKKKKLKTCSTKKTLTHFRVFLEFFDFF